MDFEHTIDFNNNDGHDGIFGEEMEDCIEKTP